VPSRGGTSNPANPWSLRVCLAIVCCIAWAGVTAAPAAAAPTAAFNYTPDSPLTLETITFSSQSFAQDPENIVSQTWDLNGDGTFGDANGATVTRSYNRPGSRSVSLRVRDSAGEEDVATQSVVTANRAPLPNVAVLPADPTAGQEVTFFSTATDPDGFIASQAWDFDGDGKFDDGNQTLVKWTFPSVGEYLVRLRVTDDSLASAVVNVGVKVTPTTVVVQTASGPRVLPLLSPFPVVRISGLVRKRGVLLRLLSVNAPLGSTVTVICHGKGCPFKRRAQKVRAAKKSPQVPRPVHIRRFAKKVLRKDTTIRILVSGPGAVGKYTRLRVRAGKVPARLDRCISPYSRAPILCP
jgi:PKD repeat protein